MPKRRLESKEERCTRKVKEYEDKETSETTQRIIYSSDDEDVQPEDHLQSDPPLTADFQSYDHNIQSHGELTTIQSADPVAGPSVDQAADSVDLPSDGFDPELLQVLGDLEEEAIEYGEDIEESLAKRFHKILLNSLKKETKEELHKKYLFPKNVQCAKAPTLNPEIGFLPEIYKARDKRLLNKQDQLGRGLSALVKAMTELLRKKKSDISEVLKTLNDAAKLIADSHFAETETRQTVIIPLVDKLLAETFKNRKRDSLLFGEKLDDAVRSSRGINKTSQMIQGPTPSTSSLNWRGPYPRTHQQFRGNQTYPHRGSGQQRASQYRRAPLPPPPARMQGRRPPPPPPPQSARRQPPAPSQRAPVDRPRRD